MKCIIIDDDSISHKILENYINNRPDLILVGQFINAQSTIPFLEKEKVDLIFLDVEMPKMSGIDFLRSYNDLPQVILISEHKQYAVEGFNLNVTDYLIKPIQKERFGEAIDKVFERRIFNRIKNDHYQSIAVKQRSGYINIATDNILYIEGFGDYINVVLSEEKKVIVLSTIKKIEEQLTPFNFMRIHRSYIVNLKKVEKIIENNVYVGNKIIPVSRTYRSSFIHLFKIKQNE